MTGPAVVFDIGNVLLNWDPKGFYDRVIGPKRRHALFTAVDLDAMNAAIDLGAPFKDTIYATAESHPNWAPEIRLWHDRWLEMASPEIPGSVHLLRALRQRGVPVYALSNFGVDSFSLAQSHYPFLSEFDGAVVSGHLGCAKPDPAIYAALERMAGVAGAALVFVDDRAENIAAGAARGWQTHLFDGPEAWAARLVDMGLLAPAEADP